MWDRPDQSEHRSNNQDGQHENHHGSNSPTVKIPPPVAVMPLCVDLLPNGWHDDGMKTVAVIVQDGAEPFGLGSICEVWGEPYHPEDDNPIFDFTVCTPRPGRVRGRV